jgi:hypothetical protein
MHNDKSKSKDKCNKECRAKNARRRRDSHPEASHDGASPKESLQKHETLRRKAPSGKPQRVSITDSFGASPVSSASDYSAGRDPGRATTTLTRN